MELLGHAGALDYTQKAEALVITPPAEKPCDHAYAFKIKLTGEVGDRMIAGQPFTMPEESMSLDDINRKHFGKE